MIGQKVEWPEPVLEKLRSFQSDHYTQEETYDYIVQFCFLEKNSPYRINKVCISRKLKQKEDSYAFFSNIIAMMLL
jgi:hypothetical protein